MVVNLKIKAQTHIEFTPRGGEKISTNRYRVDCETDESVGSLSCRDDLGAFIGKVVPIEISAFKSKGPGIFECSGSLWSATVKK